MNQQSLSSMPSIDVNSITATIERALASAGLQTQSGPMQGVTETIRRALSSAGMRADSPAATDASVIDVEARVVGAPQREHLAAHRSSLDHEPAAPGQCVTRQFANQAGARFYKLYVPASNPGTPMPLIVMLHGCTQSPDDFATGTQMNRLAEEHGFIVVYPEQAANANGSKCWNWFKASDQMRDSGEPSLIAGITRDVATHYPVDPRRIFVAGLSAGAAMAIILGETYPELYAGVGAHSGLPYAAAHDMPSAFAAMNGGGKGMPDLSKLPGVAGVPRRKATRFVPTIAFHGDADRTVGLGNGAELVRQANAALAVEAGEPRSATTTGVSSRGRSYSRTVHSDAAGRPRVESWVLHGSGHAWSGGDASGSYTDPTGPDASAEMIRFFLEQPQVGPA
ncbi:MAG: PHB depolymerase family esterase [Burkholderiaceae bacterium]